MVYYLIVCRSMTYAQRTASALERAGVPAQILRAPKSIAADGCSFCVRLAERHLSSSLAVLNRLGVTSNRIYISPSDGVYYEVEP